MSNQPTKNNHFIPQFLTKPWEDKHANLKLYSFDSSEIQEEPSATALSAEGYPDELETFLRKHVENPINELRGHLQKGKDDSDDPRFYRAATVLIAFQRARNRAVAEKKWLDELLLLVKKPKEFLDGLQSEQAQGLLCVQTPSGSRPLWFPSSGSFYLLGKGLTWKGKRFVPVAIPLDTQRALILYPLGADADLSTRSGLRDVVASNAPALLSDASAGQDTATRVAIPPGASESDSELASLLQQARKKNKAAIADHNQAVSPASRGSES